MNPQSLALISVRLIGLLLAALALPGVGRAIDGVLGYMSWWAWSPINAAMGLPSSLGADWHLFTGLGPVLQFLVGLSLLMRGQWAVARVVRGLAGTCPRCGYDVSDLKASRCPECGTKLPEAPKI